MSDLVTGRSPRPRPPLSRRRDKPQLSCNQCRRKKLKCSRSHPCENCTKRGLDLRCTYPTGRTSTGAAQPSESRRPSGGVQDRLRQLEEQVASMTNNGPMLPETGLITHHSTTSSDSGASINVNEPLNWDGENPPSLPNLAQMAVPGNGNTYSNCSRPSSLPNASFEYRLQTQSDDQTLEPSASIGMPKRHNPGPLLLYGCIPVSCKEELLDGLPPKSTTDRLLSYYFRALDLSSILVHGPEFLKQYGEFWESPKTTHVAWIGLLFGMLGIATQHQQATSERSTTSSENNIEDKSIKYKERLVQSLMLAHYTDGGPFIVQALVHYIALEYISRRDANPGVWITVGILVNVATRMGYPCNPDTVPNISPYEEEMRKRIWTAIHVLDSGISEQMGMPRHIKDVGNLIAPRNLLDSDFNEGTVQLPPERPDTEATAMLYFKAKALYLKACSLVADMTSKSELCPYSEVMGVDKVLNETRLNLPASFKWRRLSESITDTVFVVCQRLYLEIVYHKARIVLHLKYGLRTDNSNAYAYSRRTILDAVFKSLELQHIVDEETKPSGQLFQIRWRFTSIFQTDFLVASTAACFLLEYHRSSMSEDDLDTAKRLCRRSQGILLRAAKASNEAAKVAEALRVTLEMFNEPIDSSVPSQGPSTPNMSCDSYPWSSLALPDFSGGFGVSISPLGLFDGIDVIPPVENPLAQLLVPVWAGQSSNCLSPGA